MGNFCCGNPSHHSEQEPGLQNEREALLSSCSSCVVNEQITSSQNSVFSQNMSQLQNKIGSAGICNNGAVATKSFPLRASTQTGPDLKVVQDEKDDSLHTAQRIESESNLQKPAGKVQDTNATQEVKLAYTVNGITSAEDHQIDSNSWKRISTSENPEKEEKYVHIEAMQKTMKNNERKEVVDTVSQKCQSNLLTQSAVGTYSSIMDNSASAAKRARIFQGSNCNASLKEEDGEAEMVLDEDEERAKTFQNKQSDCRMEEMNNCQPNDELICASAQVIELVSDTPELKEDLSKDEGSFWEAGIAEETAENMKACNQECFDGEEDLYRDEAEIEKEKNQRLTSESQPAAATKWSTVEPGVDVLEYCAREWKGNTAKAQLMKEAYEAVRQTFSSVRRVRGDNYCALRAALFQILSNVKLLPCLQQDDLIQLPEKLIAANYIWIKQWYFGVQDSGNENPVEKLMEYLTVLKQQWIQICEIDSVKERQAVCEEIFKNNQEEYRLYEAMKILMLAKAIELKNDQVQEKEIPLFCWLLFARDTSADPYQFMKNHLNHVGYTGGLDQVEMFLLGYSLQLTIRVFRLYKFGTDEFVTFYPNDHKEDWPMVTLITEDDRHYNVPVENAQVTQI
ncbi:ubiquitin thioesterase otulin-like isoform X2 [Stegostoma tigrinum]|uniref:ubiquitin thioesterase otulin-like isoform X2 n=1 Tax=Stegostoma tigrinum TaxID=3053191 RepID=UPI00286FEF12|nr:ubiquitin thioesterase otulin-like isoform X2 [Stegostoma tigrinum]